MRVRNFIIGLIMGALCLPNLFAQSTATNTTKATAQLSSTCVISAQNVSFGALILPLTSQNASSILRVTCTKSSPYTITMGTMSNIWLVVANGTSTWYGYNAATDTRIDLPTAGCGTMTGGQCVTAGGYTVQDAGRSSSQLCTFPRGCTVYKAGASYGSMLGAAKGDSIAYSIQHPTDSSKVWNTTNSYASTGTGVNQNISIIAQILPAQSSSFPTPDNYSDTVTTQISF